MSADEKLYTFDIETTGVSENVITFQGVALVPDPQPFKSFYVLDSKLYNFNHDGMMEVFWAYMKQHIVWSQFVEFVKAYADYLKVIKPELFTAELNTTITVDYDSITAAEPKTQKAKGIKFIARNNGNLSTIPFEILTGEERDNDAVDKFVARYAEVFARPCPEVPRHGFVDSRIVKTKQEVIDLFNQVREVDANGELVIMQPINAAYNSVITPFSLTVGKGNDGATAGKETRTFPLMGTWQEAFGDVAGAGMAAGDVPYVETVSKLGTNSFSHYITQMRGGPKLETRAADYVPIETSVRRIIKAEGDLLEWETTMKNCQSEYGVVIDHSGGSLTSHYGVHAILNKIPVLTTRSPKLGETLQIVDDTVKHDYMAVIAGMIDSLNTAYVKRKRRRNADRVAAMLYASQYFSSIGGTDSYYIGYAVGTMLNFGTAACGGEYRHSEGETKSSKSRDSIYLKATRNFLKSRVVLAKWARGFALDDWGSGFGGIKWYDCAEAIIDLDTATRKFMRSPTEQSFNEMMMSMNRAINCAHNGGWWFNKYADDSTFDSINQESLRTILNATIFLYNLAPKTLVVDNLEFYNKYAGAKVINPKVERNYKLTMILAQARLIDGTTPGKDFTKEMVKRYQNIRIQVKYSTDLVDEIQVFKADIADNWPFDYKWLLPSYKTGAQHYVPLTIEEVGGVWRLKLENGFLLHEIPVKMGFSKSQFGVAPSER